MPKRMSNHRPLKMRSSAMLPHGLKKHQVYGYRWQKLRMFHLKRFPLCNRCQADSKLVPATDVHHIHDVSDGGPLLPGSEGLESLCHSCHSRHTYWKSSRKASQL